MGEHGILRQTMGQVNDNRLFCKCLYDPVMFSFAFRGARNHLSVLPEDTCARRPVSRVLSRMAIHLGRALPRVSCDRPGRRRKHLQPVARPRRPYSVLLPVGFTVPSPLPETRCALTAPFHPCRRASEPAVCFLRHCPWSHLRRVLPGTVFPWSPDFPPPGSPGSGHPAVWQWDSMGSAGPGQGRPSRQTPVNAPNAPDDPTRLATAKSARPPG